MSDNFFLQRNKAVAHYILKHEQLSRDTDAWIKAVAKENAAQAVNDERCVPVIPVDFVIHDEAHPFCDDMKCPCHSGATWDDIFYYNEHLEQPFDDGLLTVAEKHRLWEGRQV